jgi:uncharacterized phiE125 gp8 family phage protein
MSLNNKNIQWALTLVTAPAVEPITLTEAKAHLRIDSTDDDSYITALIVAARTIAEERTNRALITQTWDYVLDRFPCGNTITMRKPKLQSVTSITYIGSDDVTNTMSAADYIVDTDSGRVVLGYGKQWPTVVLRPASAIRIRFVAGYGLAVAVPQPLKQAIFFLVAHWYENRQPVDKAVEKVPMTFDYLIGPYRVMRLQ